MKAIVVKEFVKNYSDLAVSDVPDPSLSSDDVLVHVTHSGLNYVDLLYVRGKHQNNRSLVTPPFVAGLEFAGVVLSAPRDSAFRAGDRVFGGGLGSFAERIAVKEGALRHVPRGWSLEDAAGTAATAPVCYGALARVARVQKGETVLVHAAAGGLGVMAVQIALALGAGKVIGTVGSEGKAKVVKELGASDVVLYGEEGWEKRVQDCNGGKGVDVVFDSVGLVEKSTRCTRYAGRIVIIGFAGREGNLEKIAANRILLKSLTVHGYRYGETGRQIEGETAEVWKGLEDLLKRGLIRPVIYGESFDGLESVPSAMYAMADRKVWGKGIIKVQSEPEKANL